VGKQQEAGGDGISLYQDSLRQANETLLAGGFLLFFYYLDAGQFILALLTVL